MNKDFLFRLIETPSPSGAELAIQKVVMEEMKPYVDTFITHHSYNLISVIHPEDAFKVLLCGHIDEIGLMITDIQDNGLIHVTNTGNSVGYMYVGQHVQVLTKKGIIHGVFANTDVVKEHFKISDLLLDIGTYTKDESSKLVQVGDYVVHSFTHQELQNNTLSARALDDRLGAFIILEAIKQAKDAKVGLYAATTVGEETTTRGATFATNIVKPTIGIIVDVTHTTDHDGKAPSKGLIRLGGGPAITIGSIISPVLLELVEESSKRQGIQLQYEVSSERTYTDSDKVHFLQNGIPVLLISIPLRYMHSSVEVCNYQDVLDIIALISDLLIHLDPNQNFDPFKK
ncbi:MAG: M42 family peptidase [Bacilli bacterium]